jgi:hypothetical protein
MANNAERWRPEGDHRFFLRHWPFLHNPELRDGNSRHAGTFTAEARRDGDNKE